MRTESKVALPALAVIMCKPRVLSACWFTEGDDELLSPQALGGIEAFYTLEGDGVREVSCRSIEALPIPNLFPMSMEAFDILIELFIIVMKRKEMSFCTGYGNHVQREFFNKEVGERGGSSFLYSDEEDVWVALEGAMVVRYLQLSQC